MRKSPGDIQCGWYLISTAATTATRDDPPAPLVELDPRRHCLAELVGGKAASLAAMRGAGLPVPPTWLLLPRGERTGVDAAEVLAKCGIGPLFVRSSFSIEDREAQSYAGQGETFGHLRAFDVPAAAQAVWDSWHAAEGAAYRRRAGLSDVRRGAVIVQREIVPVWSGVMFTHSPDAIGPWARIEAVKGYGQALVAGQVAPVVLEIHRRRGVALDATPAAAELVAAARRLRRMIGRIERLVGGPADAEWAVDARGRVWLLQARPVAGRRETFWSGVLGNEFWSGDVSALMFGTVGRAIEQSMLREPVSVLGPPPPTPLLRRFRGRVYVDVGALTQALAIVPAWARSATLLKMFPPSVRERSARECAVDHPPLSRGFFAAGLKFLRSGFPWVPYMQPLSLGRLRRRADEWGARPPATNAAQLVAEIDALLATLGGALRWVVWGMVYAYLAVPLLDFLLGARAQAAGAGSLYRGLPFDPVRELDDDLRALSRQLGPALDAPDFATFVTGLDAAQRDAFAALIARWGHRADERDLRARRWHEHPEAAWLLLQLARHQPPTIDLHWTRFLRRSADLPRRPWRIAWLLLTTCVAHFARLYLGYRERMRDVADRYLMVLRQRLLLLAAATDERDPWRRGWQPGQGLGAVAAAVSEATDAPLPPFLCGDVALADDAAAVSGLRGMGVSAGIAEGRAVWVHGPGDLRDFHPGDVLLSSYLDPSLSIALERAAAAAFVFGGMLSHGAIIAREYGVPAVVGVADLAAVRAGDRVRVDGVHGTVSVLVPCAPSAT